MDFAIVGMDCLLPGASSAEEWVSNSRHGHSAITEVPEGRWPRPPASFLASQVGVADHTVSLRGGFVDDLRFDPGELDLAGLRVDELDPLYGWAIHVCREAARHVDLNRQRTALFMANLSLPSTGAVRSTAQRFLDELRLDVPFLDRGRSVEIRHSELPALLAAHALRLEGEVCALDAACASGLYAVALGCNRLRTGAADAVICAGVNRADSAYLFVGFSQLRALSPTGVPRPFDQAADGLVVGEGAGAVVLKRIDDAVRDRDEILAVIKGGSVGNDGKKGNLLAPDASGQLRTLHKAWQATKLDPRTLGYVECHATGTKVGDPTEVKALRELLRRFGKSREPIALSSAKAQIGHTVTAAGLAGLIRVVGAVREGFIPSALNVEHPIAELTGGDRFTLLDESTPWTSTVRRAAVSAFGFGGTNAHIIVENAPHSPTLFVQDHRQDAPRYEQEPLAIVGIGAQIGRECDVRRILAAFRAKTSLKHSSSLQVTRGLHPAVEGSWIEEVEIDPRRFRIPPVELPKILPQQLAILNAAGDALQGTRLDSQRVASIIGMALDPHVGESVIRWALEGEHADRIAPALDAARVQGSLPNLVANRIAAQFDLFGASYTVSAGPISGICALRHALGMLQAQEIDAAVVGAVDLPAHGSHIEDGMGEAAVALVVQRLQDARPDQVIAVIDQIEIGTSGQGRSPHRELTGNCGAADGLVALLYTLSGGEPGQVSSEAWPKRVGSLRIRPGTAQPTAPHRCDAPVRIPHSGPPVPALEWSGSWSPTRVPVPTPGPSNRSWVRLDDPVEPVSEALPWSQWVKPRGVQEAPPAAVGTPDHDKSEAPTGPPASERVEIPPTRRRSSATPVPPVNRPGSTPGPSEPPGVPTSGPPGVNQDRRLALQSLSEATPQGPLDSLILLPALGPATATGPGSSLELPPPLPRSSGPLPKPPPRRRMRSKATLPPGALRAPVNVPPGAGGRGVDPQPAARPLGFGSPLSSPEITPPPSLPPPPPSLPPPPPRRSTPPPSAEPAYSPPLGSEASADHAGLADIAVQLARSTQAAAAAHERFLASERHVLEELERVNSTLERAAAYLDAHPTSGRGKPSLPPPPPRKADPARPELKPPPPAPVPPPTAAAPTPVPPAVRAPLPPPVAPPTTKTEPAPPSTAPVRFDADQLLAHASGKLSDVFGPEYADLDAFEPRTRMPEPPLLLCSRVLSVEGTRGDLGPSSLVTEYDIPEQAWWSHDGKAPPCVVVESGQADLFLVSYLGIDEICRGERLYRLLDCDLTFHAERPRLGQTLRHHIRIKSFARMGDTVLFYFEYDCTCAGEPVLSMRNGCAGFFTPAELAEPKGLQPLEILDPRAPLEPLLPGAPSSLDEAAIAALTTGRYTEAFGPAFAPANGSPLILAPSKYRVVHRVRDLSLTGAPHGLGGLVAEQDLADDDWFNDCHFKGDPCMPGTLMFDGCTQALQVWLMAMGYPAEYPREASFEPIPECTAKLRCRGQIVPGHSLATYEVRVKDAGSLPHPWAIADVILSVDGTPVVSAEDVGVRIVGARIPLIEASTVDEKRIFEYSIGDPVLAFGADYDVPHRVARMPGPPYLFMTRVTRVEGEPGLEEANRSVVIDYDIPEHAWYFDADPDSSMPWAILLEIALQPCGWLTAWQGAARRGEGNRYFRNLGGTLTQRCEVFPWTKTLTTTAKQTRIADAAGMALHFFDIEVRAGDQVVLSGNTSFGYFQSAALEDQRGLPAPEWMGRGSALEEPVIPQLSVRDDWKMIDWITVAEPQGGSQELGYYEATKAIDVAQWFFTAHFHGDPVMPGSLGLEAMLQLARWVLGQRRQLGPGRWVPFRAEAALSWLYRGQVISEREHLTVHLEVVSLGEADIACNAVLSADGLPIYQWEGFGGRWVSEPPPRPVAPKRRRAPPVAALLDRFKISGDIGQGRVLLDPALHPWLADHCPTLTVPALPMAFAAEIAAEAALQLCPEQKVVCIPEVRAERWVHCGEGPVELVVVAVRDQGRVAVTLSVQHENTRFPKLSGPKVHMKAIVELGDMWPEPPEPPEPLDAPHTRLPIRSYYNDGHTFHGPTLQGMMDLGTRNAMGADAVFHTKPDSELLGEGFPDFVLDPLLLDTATHPMFSSQPEIWVAGLEPGKLAYPVRAANMRFYGPRPQGEITASLRKARGDHRKIGFECVLTSTTGVWCTFLWVESLVDAGPLLGHPAHIRKTFLLQGQPHPAVRVGTHTRFGWRVRKRDLVEPLPGTTVHLLCTPTEIAEWERSDDRPAWAVERIAAKEAVRGWLRTRLRRDVHPRSLQILALRDAEVVVSEAFTLTAQEYVDHLAPTRVEIKLVWSSDGVEARVSER